MSSLIPPGADLSKIPFAANPDGSPPNFTDSAPSLATAMITAGSIFAALAVLAVSFRMLACYKGKFHLDDAFSLLSLITATAYLGEVLSNHLPVSLRHAWDVPLSTVDAPYIKKITTAGFLAGPSIWAARAAILVLQLRIFKPKRWFRITTYVILTCLTVTHWSNIPVFIALCVPHNSSQDWNFDLLEQCFPASLHGAITGGIGAVFDIIMLILPQPLIFKLHLSFAKKISLALTFAAGFLATVASIISLYYRVLLYQGQDITWNSGNVYICVVVETYTLIIVGCTPAIAAFWKTKVSSSKFYHSVKSILVSGQLASHGTEVLKSDINSTPSSVKHESSNLHSTNDHSGIQKTIHYSVLEEDRASDEIELTGVKGNTKSRPYKESF